MSEEAANDEAMAWSARSAKLDRLTSQRLWIPEPTAALEVLGLVGRERGHQAYIAWLLNPGGSHGLSSEVLANLLRQQESVVPVDLSLARVRTEHVQAQSRADIVVTMRDRTLVIELKVHSGEGDEQTRRLADDHSGSSNPLFVFLTLNGDEPLDRRFQRMRLGEFAGCLQAALSNAPEPRSQNEEYGRATASDYLRALERMCGMGPVNQHAARFWLRHGDELMKARNEADRLLGMLPDRWCCRTSRRPSRRTCSRRPGWIRRLCWAVLMPGRRSRGGAAIRGGGRRCCGPGTGSARSAAGS